MITSLIDNDLYKFTMQHAVLALYPDAEVSYEFINRRPSDRFNDEFFAVLLEAIGEMADLQLQRDEQTFLERRCPYLKPAYLEHLAGYRYDPSEVDARLDDGGALSITIRGPWHRTILWEVPLLALISELHGRHVDTGWTEQGQLDKIRAKSRTLQQAGCALADFGTRRRRSFAIQDLVVGVLCDNPGFVGTSNVHLAHRHGVQPIGTMAHEWVMAHAVLADLRHVNRRALEAWRKVYRGQLGVALTDTYTTGIFLDDFDAHFARLYDGVRQDSGCPLEFADRIIEHYVKLGIDPATKTIVFSDGLDAEMAVELKRYCGERIRCAFGIGTNLTNDFAGSDALNIVIKLATINRAPVVKLTDDAAKATGQPDALHATKQALFAAPPADT